MELIYKVCGRQQWDEALASGEYRGSVHDRRDGFIHFSNAAQLAVTCAKHFAGIDDLVLVAVDAESLGEALVHEPSRGGQLFAHLYGPLPTAAAVWVRPLPWDGKLHRIPERLGEDPS